MSRLHTALTGFTGLVVLGLVVAALAIAAGIVYMLDRQAEGIVEAFRPRIDSRVVLRGAIEDLRAEGKLVVLSADVTAESESSTGKRIFFDLIDAGTTTVRVRAPARVQYVVPLSEISREDFLYDPETGRLVLTLPNPRLDTSIVEVSTDPSRIEVYKEIGWLRLDALSGRYNEERARRLLRDAAIEAGRSGYWLDRAQESTRTQMAGLLAPLLGALRTDVTFSIAFQDDGARRAEEAESLPTPRRP